MMTHLYQSSGLETFYDYLLAVTGSFLACAIPDCVMRGLESWETPSRTHPAP
jgi:hypothetical protein